MECVLELCINWLAAIVDLTWTQMVEKLKETGERGSIQKKVKHNSIYLFFYFLSVLIPQLCGEAFLPPAGARSCVRAKRSNGRRYTSRHVGVTRFYDYCVAR